MHTKIPYIFPMTYNMALKDQRNVNANRNIYKHKIVKVKTELIFGKEYIYT
jgi:hypothetical protein